MDLKFKPAELTTWGCWWKIVFYQVDPATGLLKRFVRTFGINKIKDESLRRRRADELLKELNDTLLPMGWPFVQPEPAARGLPATPVKEAVEFAAGLKMRGRAATVSAYRYSCNMFVEYLVERKLDGIIISKVDKGVAVGFLDWIVVDRKLSNVSHNNLGSKMRTLFEVLRERGYVDVNPFHAFRKLKEEQKERRPLTTKEKQVLAAEIKRKDRRLYLAVMIMYYCFLRKTEMLHLKFRFFDFKNGVIRMPGTGTKNTKTETVTMPKALMDLLQKEFDFKTYPPHWYVFGERMAPGAKPCSKNTPTTRHRKIVDGLGKAGKLTDTKGIHFYSWKDTGALNMVERNVNILEIQKQLRHSSLATTQRYLGMMCDVIAAISDMETDI